MPRTQRSIDDNRLIAKGAPAAMRVHNFQEAQRSHMVTLVKKWLRGEGYEVDSLTDEAIGNTLKQLVTIKAANEKRVD